MWFPNTATFPLSPYPSDTSGCDSDCADMTPIGPPSFAADRAPNPDSLNLHLRRLAVQLAAATSAPTLAVTRLVESIPLALDQSSRANQLSLVPLCPATAFSGPSPPPPLIGNGKSRRHVNDPSGNFFQIMPLPMNNVGHCLAQIATNVSSYQWESVTASSRSTYQSGYNHFVRFTEALGTDTLLQQAPPEFSHVSPRPPYNWFICAMLGFLTYLRVNVMVTPSTINTYVSGVLFFLKCRNVDVTAMTDNLTVKMVRAGMLKSWRAIPGNAKSDNQTLPVSADMISRWRSYFLHHNQPMAQTKRELAISTALVFAFVLLARISEYLVTDSDHHIRGKHIIFVMRTSADSTATVNIDASQAYKYDISSLVEMYATIKDAKNDPDGNGHRFCYQVQAADSPSLLCVASEMFRCAAILRPQSESAFFAYAGDVNNPQAWAITQHEFNALISQGAKLYGFNPDRFHSHSLRIGGASALAASGAPSWVIQLTGRWKSLAFLQYIRLASTQFQRSIEAQTNGTTFNASHIRMWNPALRVPTPAIIVGEFD